MAGAANDAATSAVIGVGTDEDAVVCAAKPAVRSTDCAPHKCSRLSSCRCIFRCCRRCSCHYQCFQIEQGQTTKYLSQYNFLKNNNNTVRFSVTTNCSLGRCSE